MEEIAWDEYFEPISNAVVADEFNRSQLASHIHYYGLGKEFPSLDHPYTVAIIGCGYDIHDLSANIFHTPDHVRYWLYRLYKGNYSASICDLGNLVFRNSAEEVSARLSQVIAYLLSKNIIPLIIGGGKELTYPHYLAYTAIGKFCNLLSVSPTIDFKELVEEQDASNYLGRILSDANGFLFSCANMGYQTYFVPPELLELFRNFHFEMVRLGEVRGAMELTEPVIRNADFISVDLGAVKYADAPNCISSTPNGLTSDEICRISRYAGLSMKCSGIGFYGIRPGGNLEWTDHHLMAQAIWHFLEGVFLRKPESLDVYDHTYMKFHVAMNMYPDEINFYRNMVSEKWWMAVPLESKSKKYPFSEYLVPCSEQDYENASMGNVPDRWLEFYRRMND